MGYGSGTGSNYDNSSDLLPHRLDSVNLQNFERGTAAVVFLMATVSIVLGVIHGMSYHIEHLVMAVITLMCTVQFTLLARLYTRDEIQDRKLVYFSGVCVAALSVGGLLYSTGWVEAAACFPASCISGSANNSFYNPYVENPITKQKTGGCLQFDARSNPMNPTVNHGSMCQRLKVNADTGQVSMFNLTNFKEDTITCNTAKTILTTCFGFTQKPFPLWICPTNPPSPSPSPSPHPPSPPSPAIADASPPAPPSPP